MKIHKIMIFKCLNKISMIEYIAFIIQRDISHTDLIKMFASRNIFIDNDFYENILTYVIYII